MAVFTADGNEKPKTVTVAPGASATVTVTVDVSAADITQPGTYTAKFAIGTDTSYATPVLPVCEVARDAADSGFAADLVFAAAGVAPNDLVVTLVQHGDGGEPGRFPRPAGCRRRYCPRRPGR